MQKVVGQLSESLTEALSAYISTQEGANDKQACDGQKPATEEVRATSHKARTSDTCGNMKDSHDSGVHVQTNFGKKLTRSERTSEPIGQWAAKPSIGKRHDPDKPCTEDEDAAKVSPVFDATPATAKTPSPDVKCSIGPKCNTGCWVGDSIKSTTPSAQSDEGTEYSKPNFDVTPENRGGAPEYARTTSDGGDDVVQSMAGRERSKACSNQGWSPRIKKGAVKPSVQKRKRSPDSSVPR
ncbi:hypothetical protein PVAP13_9KG407852 [Panicum virgatum]|uniref:Uncharacterized protein n=1 Tax=Panicum virgatum TaxID=38727 RepID=A0A8T0NDV7_PANVG|nr:hypothetical protein PVAP13_9KG407852 [Panicum virgatum]